MNMQNNNRYRGLAPRPRKPGLVEYDLRLREDFVNDLRMRYLQYADHSQVCKSFGCGRTLSLQEKLYGDHCIHHQKKRQ
jgi:hypothetical protein